MLTHKCCNVVRARRETGKMNECFLTSDRARKVRGKPALAWCDSNIKSGPLSDSD